jgi:hypothetical protein
MPAALTMELTAVYLYGCMQYSRLCRRGTCTARGDPN